MLNDKRNDALHHSLCRNPDDSSESTVLDGLDDIRKIYCPLLHTLSSASRAGREGKDNLNKFVRAAVTSHLTPCSARCMLGLFRAMTPVQLRLCEGAVAVAPAAPAAPAARRARVSLAPDSAVTCEGTRAWNGTSKDFLASLLAAKREGAGAMPLPEEAIIYARATESRPDTEEQRRWSDFVPAVNAVTDAVKQRATDLFVMWLPSWHLSGKARKDGTANVQRFLDGAPFNFTQKESWQVATEFWKFGWQGRPDSRSSSDFQAATINAVRDIRNMLRFAQFRESDLVIATAAYELYRFLGDQQSSPAAGKLPLKLKQMGLLLTGSNDEQTSNALSPGLDVLVMAGALRAMNANSKDAMNANSKDAYKLADRVNKLLGSAKGWQDAHAADPNLARDLNLLYEGVEAEKQDLGTFETPKASWVRGIKVEAVDLLKQCHIAAAQNNSTVEKDFESLYTRLRELRVLTCNLVLLFVQTHHENFAPPGRPRASACLRRADGREPLVALMPWPGVTSEQWRHKGAQSIADALQEVKIEKWVESLANAFQEANGELKLHLGNGNITTEGDVLRIGKTSKAVWECVKPKAAVPPHESWTGAATAAASERQRRAQGDVAMKAAIRCYFYKNLTEPPRTRVPESDMKCTGLHGQTLAVREQAERFVNAVIHKDGGAEFKKLFSCVVSPLGPGDDTKRCRLAFHTMPGEAQSGAMDAGCSSSLRLGADAKKRPGTWGGFARCASNQKSKPSFSPGAKAQNQNCNDRCDPNALPNQKCQATGEARQCAPSADSRWSAHNFEEALKTEFAARHEAQIGALGCLEHLEIGHPFVLFLQPEANCVPYFRFPSSGQDVYTLVPEDRPEGLLLPVALARLVLGMHLGALLRDVCTVPEALRFGVVSCFRPTRTEAATCAARAHVDGARRWFPWVQAPSLEEVEDDVDVTRVTQRLQELGLKLAGDVPTCFGRCPEGGTLCLRPLTVQASGTAPQESEQLRDALVALEALAALAQPAEGERSDDEMLGSVSRFALQGTGERRGIYWASSYAASLEENANLRAPSPPIGHPESLAPKSPALEFLRLPMDVVVYAEASTPPNVLVH